MGIVIGSQELSNNKSITVEGAKMVNWITFTMKTSGIKKKT